MEMKETRDIDRCLCLSISDRGHSLMVKGIELSLDRCEVGDALNYHLNPDDFLNFYGTFATGIQADVNVSKENEVDPKQIADELAIKVKASLLEKDILTLEELSIQEVTDIMNLQKDFMKELQKEIEKTRTRYYECYKKYPNKEECENVRNGLSILYPEIDAAKNYYKTSIQKLEAHIIKLEHEEMEKLYEINASNIMTDDQKKLSKMRADYLREVENHKETF